MALSCFVSVFALTIVAGCNKSDAPPATQPATTAPSASKPGPAVLTVGGEPTEFAVTHLNVTRDEASLHLQLYGSDLAKPSQSSFYLDLSVDGDEPESLPGKVWRKTFAPDEEIDGSIGIFLGGDAIRLQPKTVELTFVGAYPNLTISLKGTFLRDGDETKEVKASGTFAVRAKEKSGN